MVPPVSRTEGRAAVARAAARCRDLASLDSVIPDCRVCPRLVAWREEVARTKRRAYADEAYWGRPVPGFGVADPEILVLGLAPGAHGANRTGRVFTGDRSGDWLYAALFRAGLADRPTSLRADDGLTLHRTRVTAAVRCAPPGNRPEPVERDACSPWLHRELSLIAPTVRVVVALGGFAWAAALSAAPALGSAVPRPSPRFAHGAEVALLPDGEGIAPSGVRLLGCYHPSQQNTFTGRLTEGMLDAVLARAVAVADEPAHPGG